MPYKNKFTEKERWNKHGVNVKNFVLNQGSATKFYFKVRRMCRIWLVEFQTLYKPKILKEKSFRPIKLYRMIWFSLQRYRQLLSLIRENSPYQMK